MHAVSPVFVRLQRLALALLLMMLAGCASMSKEECLTADWTEVGMRDGQNGQPRATFASHVEACREAGVVADQRQYMAGWERGIPYYCTPENGLEVGRRGRSYSSGTCPAMLEPAFRFRYERGYEVYRAQQEINRLDSRLRDKQRKLDDSRDDSAKRALRNELRDIDSDLRRARDRLREAEWRAYR